MAVSLFRCTQATDKAENGISHLFTWLTTTYETWPFILRKGMYYAPIYALSSCKRAYIAKPQATPYPATRQQASERRPQRLASNKVFGVWKDKTRFSNFFQFCKHWKELESFEAVRKPYNKRDAERRKAAKPRISRALPLLS